MERPFVGGSSHLDFFLGLLSSLSISLILLAWPGTELLLGLGVVLGEAVPDSLLPALLHTRGAGPAAASVSAVPAEVSTPSVCSLPAELEPAVAGTAPGVAADLTPGVPVAACARDPEKVYAGNCVLFKVVFSGLELSWSVPGPNG